MLTRNVAFQEEYKRLDNFCRDCLLSTEGVSEYIRQMEASAWRGAHYVSTWDVDYKQLKHFRWLRNQLAHEVGTLDADFCTEEDLALLKKFYSRMMNGEDPFSLMRKAEEAERKLVARRRQEEKQQGAQTQEVCCKNESEDAGDEAAGRRSFFGRIIDRVVSWFR